jgi:lysophospholipase L1-like esterase
MDAEARQGVSGSTAAQWASDFDGRLSLARDTDSDAVVISLLGNDARHAVSDGQVTADEIAAGLRDMRAVVQAVLRPLTIVLLYADPFCGTQAQARVGVPLLNGAIRWACNGLPVVFADTGAWLTREHFDGRDIHPTRAGHAVIAAQMLDIISASNAPADQTATAGMVRQYVSNIKMGDLPYSKTDCVADLDKPRPIKPRKPAKLPPSVPARACNLSKTCALRKAGKCTPVHCANAYHFVANAGGEH